MQEKSEPNEESLSILGEIWKLFRKLLASADPSDPAQNAMIHKGLEKASTLGLILVLFYGLSVDTALGVSPEILLKLWSCRFIQALALTGYIFCNNVYYKHLNQPVDQGAELQQPPIPLPLEVRFMRVYGILLPQIVAQGTNVLVYLTGGWKSPYYVGVAMTMVAMTATIPWKRRHIYFQTLLMFLGYVQACRWHSPNNSTTHGFMNCMLLAGFWVICVYGISNGNGNTSASTTRSIRNDFWTVFKLLIAPLLLIIIWNKMFYNLPDLISIDSIHNANSNREFIIVRNKNDFPVDLKDGRLNLPDDSKTYAIVVATNLSSIVEPEESVIIYTHLTPSSRFSFNHTNSAISLSTLIDRATIINVNKY